MRDPDRSRTRSGCRHQFVVRAILLMGFLAAAAPNTFAQFVDEFDDPDLNGWTYATGDGHATMNMLGRDGYASVEVDATSDRHNVWWALIKRDVTEAIDLQKLGQPDHEIRVEARIRISHAPRRVNLHVNTQRTTDFHTHLMEYDIADTTGWHTISMTTRNFDARAGDTVNAQMALMDWGLGRYRVEVDYFRVDVVDTMQVGPDVGGPIPYHPPARPLESFAHHIATAEDAVVDEQHPDVNFRTWRAGDDTPVLTVDGTRSVLMRWDFDDLDGRVVNGGGVLTFTTHSIQRADYAMDEFGRIRIVEILRGDRTWTDDEVTFSRFTDGLPLNAVVNEQMIIDVRPGMQHGDTTYAVLSQPALQRLVDGTTAGLMLRALGPVSASFFASEHGEAAALHFNLLE